ncbi:MAG TPA: hypothetical protein VI732_01710 [Alphaproteobacteria bacterium]|nr:hypothetical protein [Alphaproteobacteria bacterium]
MTQVPQRISAFLDDQRGTAERADALRVPLLCGDEIVFNRGGETFEPKSGDAAIAPVPGTRAAGHE